MKFQFNINGVKFRAKLTKNALTEKITEACTARLDFQRSGNHEYYVGLPVQVKSDGCKETSQVHKNGIYYFTP